VKTLNLAFVICVRMRLEFSVWNVDYIQLKKESDTTIFVINRVIINDFYTFKDLHKKFSHALK